MWDQIQAEENFFRQFLKLLPTLAMMSRTLADATRVGVLGSHFYLLRLREILLGSC